MRDVMDGGRGGLQWCGGGVPIGAGGVAVGSVGRGGAGTNHPRKN